MLVGLRVFGKGGQKPSREALTMLFLGGSFLDMTSSINSHKHRQLLMSFWCGGELQISWNKKERLMKMSSALN